MIEKDIQSAYVMEFLCRRPDGLGYREVKCTTVNNDLFIPADLLEFVKTNSPRAWRNLVIKNNGDEHLVLSLLMEEIKARLKEATNVAIFFNRNKSITFQGESLQLVYVSGSELRGDKDFKKNIFSASEEVSYTFKVGDTKIFSIRPDVSFFLNGIYLGYMELKSVFNGQNASKDGRGKIIMDYMEAVQEYSKLAGQNDEYQNLRREMLRIFENSIHLTASDINETYVLRNVAMFCDELRKGYSDKTISVIDKKEEIKEVFKIYPVRNPDALERERFEEVMRALYSKKMIEKEILYYNFLQYDLEKRGKKKERKSNRGRLISPRPKQKFGCDKIIDRIQEFLEHEKEPDYFLNKLRAELLAQGASPERAEEIVAKRAAYCNNKYVYSLLLQYAAGFGKSNIIGWTALQLKDLRYNGEWVYDKILLVVDRLQLRDQLDTTMTNMNIDKAMFVEATNSKTFIQALQDKRRIIVVNIQKFIDMQDAIKKAKAELKSMRVAFLIDEIHRSNTGTSHEEMMNLFDELQDTFDENEGKLLAGTGKKNLIVGFTATPSEKVLARFGELAQLNNIDPVWVPFDSYSMREAIADGYILDPTKHIIAVPSKMYFELPEKAKKAIENGTDDQKYGLKKGLVYENRDRMEAISLFIVNRLLNLVYTKIRGTGKAMLAVTSIPIAISYCEFIRRIMAVKTNEPRYARYKDAPVSIVYSNNQEYRDSKSMNDGVSEEKVISNFKSAKNGLIIVVDKLQTGFDEPKLHTLFLDKEIHDINAIQTISRVDRTCKYKEECHIIDFSFNNENIDNIKTAFAKFSDIVVSDFNAQAELKVVETLYKVLKSHELFIKWFRKYTDSKSDSSQSTFVGMEMAEDMRKWIQDAIKRFMEFMQSGEGISAPETDESNEGEDDAKKLRNTIGAYTTKLNLLDGILEISSEFTDDDFLDFWRRYCEIYRDVLGKNEDSHPIIVEYDGSIGITVEPDEFEDEDDEEAGGENTDDSEDGDKKKKRKKTKQGSIDIFAMIDRLNQEEELRAERIEYWHDFIVAFFEFLKQDPRFVAMIQDDHFDRSYVQSQYKTLCRKFKRQCVDEELVNKFFNENIEYLYEAFLEYLNDPQALVRPFNFEEQVMFREAAEPKEGIANKASKVSGKYASGIAPKGYIRTLTIKQPWATLIIKGKKDVENRSWQITDLPAKVLIHAGTSVDNYALDVLKENGYDLINLPKSAILGYVTFEKCTMNYPSEWSTEDSYQWVIGEVYEFDKPIENVKGQLGLYNTEMDIDNLPPAHLIIKHDIH